MMQMPVHDADKGRSLSPVPFTDVRVAVCGAGTMGAGIAQVFATSGRPVTLYDSSADATANAVERIRRDLDGSVARGKITASDAAEILDRVRPATALEELSTATLVVEAIIEDLDAKHDLFIQLEKICAPDALLVTNTSTLSPTQIGAVLRDPTRCAGVHFFNPAQRMRLVELIPGLATSPRTLRSLGDWLDAAGRHVVQVNEAPGGIVSRLQLLVRNEAVRMVAEGVATPEDIDTAMRHGAGWPLGPIELIDLVGVDMHVNNCDSLAREMGSDRYRPHPLARKVMRAGRLGKKSGRGFYTYDPRTGARVADDTEPTADE